MLKPEYKVITFLQTSVNILQSTCRDNPGDISLKDIDCRLVTLSALTIKQIIVTSKTQEYSIMFGILLWRHVSVLL